MSMKEHVYSLLIVSSSESFNSIILNTFPPSRCTPINFAYSINEAKRMIAEKHFDLIIINSLVNAESGHNFAIDCSQSMSEVVLLLVNNDVYLQTYNKVFQHGVFTLSKPTTKNNLILALDWMISTKERLKKLENKSLSIEERMSELKLINRAKMLLIYNQDMSEDEAHRYIEKSSMDNCTPKKEIALKIIKMYS